MKTLLITAGLMLLPVAAFAQASPQNFVAAAASGGIYEIRSSQMILDADGVDADVREFAEQMIADHTKAGADLAAAAEKSGLTVPTEPLSREATKLEQLENAENKQALYLSQQDVSHNNAVVAHRSYAAGGTDENLKTYAATVVPVLEEHSDHVEMLNRH